LYVHIFRSIRGFAESTANNTKKSLDLLIRDGVLKAALESLFRLIM